MRSPSLNALLPFLLSTLGVAASLACDAGREGPSTSDLERRLTQAEERVVSLLADNAALTQRVGTLEGLEPGARLTALEESLEGAQLQRLGAAADIVFTSAVGVYRGTRLLGHLLDVYEHGIAFVDVEQGRVVMYTDSGDPLPLYDKNRIYFTGPDCTGTPHIAGRSTFTTYKLPSVLHRDTGDLFTPVDTRDVYTVDTQSYMSLTQTACTNWSGSVSDTYEATREPYIGGPVVALTLARATPPE